MASPSTSDPAVPADGSEPIVLSLDLDASGEPSRNRPAPAPSTPACSVEELQKLCDTLSLQCAEAKRERDDYARQLAAIPHSTIDAGKALLAIRQARDTLLARNHELMGKLVVTDDELAELRNQHEDLNRAHAAAIEELPTLRKECDELRRKALDLSEQKSAYLEAERAYVSAMAEGGRQLVSMTEERDDALTAGAAAQHQIEQLVTDREALREQFTTEQTSLRAQVAELHAQLAAIRQPANSLADPPPPDAISVKPLPRKDTTLAAIEKRVAQLREEPAKAEPLEPLAEQLQGYAAHSQTAGVIAAARLASTAADLAKWLRKMPAKIPATLDTLDDALALLGTLAAIKDKARLPDPTGAFVYSVDDDVDNCECIAMALEKISLRTKYAMKPEAALADLAANACDLIVLDVELPGMDGFELHSRIRALPRHAATPIIFLSGVTSAAGRVAALPGGHNRYIAKPYNLNDLSLRALLMVVQARLGA